MRERKKARHRASRRPYKSPRLTQYGTIVELTRATPHMGPVFDGDIGNPKMPTDFFKSA